MVLGQEWQHRIDSGESTSIYKRSEEERNQGVPPHWNTYFTASNVDQAVAKVIDAKGTELFGPMDVFTAGRMTMLEDRQGAAFAIWQHQDHIGCRVKGEPGAIAWNGLASTDPDDAIEFYKGLLGVESAAMEGPMEYSMPKAAGICVAEVMRITPEMGLVPLNRGVYFNVAETLPTLMPRSVKPNR